MSSTPARPAVQGRAARSAARLLAAEERWARPAQRRANLTWWNASLSGKKRDYDRMAAAERAVNRHYARPAPFQRLSRLLQHGSPDPLTRRRLERLRRAYQAMQAPRELLDRITSLSATLQEKYSTFRATFEGRPRTDNELEDVLRASRDGERVRAAWEARKQVGRVAAADVRRLAELRNAAARAAGFADFWHRQLLLDELDPERLGQTLAAVDRATDAPFRAMKADLDRLLAERFHVEPAALRPWHYGDPFFQETPDVFAPPADPVYAERDVVEIARRTYHALSFANIDAILARSDLFPRPGKNQHAYAVDIDREGDVRTFLNVEANARWMGTLLHELGHAIYQDGIDRATLPYDLRDDPQGFLNEGFAMFCEQPMFDPAWLSTLVGLPQAEAHALVPRLLAQETSARLAFARWCLTIVHFERAFYADPGQDLDRLWWDLEERYQMVPRPEGRIAPDWATKIHVATAPVYYHKYLYGRLFAAQLTQRLDERFGGWWGGGASSGAYVQEELFALGATYPWSVLVERVTGRPLGVDALARAVAWPVARL